MQGALNREDDSKTSKGPASTPTSASTDPKLSEKARKNKKKKQYRDKRDSREFRDKNTLASGVNVTEVGEKKRRRKRKDLSKVTCYNCNKLGHCRQVSKASEVKKQVSVSATSTSTTGAREKALGRNPYMQYPV